jgi:hypothetical protein
VVALVKADVKNPGSRGGVFRRSKTGKVAYGRYTPGGGITGIGRNAPPLFHPSADVPRTAEGKIDADRLADEHRAWHVDEHRRVGDAHQRHADRIANRQDPEHSHHESLAAFHHRQAETKATAASTKVPDAHRAAEFHLRSAGFAGKITHDVTPIGGKPRLSASNGDLHVSMVAEKGGGWSVLWGDGKGTSGNHGQMRFSGSVDAVKAMARVLKGGAK